MIQDKDFKVAENEDEALIERTIKNIEQKLRAAKLEIEIDEAVLTYLYKKRGQ